MRILQLFRDYEKSVPALVIQAKFLNCTTNALQNFKNVLTLPSSIKFLHKVH